MSEWANQAICKDYPFPDIWHSRSILETQKAQSICNQCPVRNDCLDWALSVESKLSNKRLDIWGVYGGLTRAQRLIMIK